MFEMARAVLFDLDGTLIRQSIDFERMRVEVLGVVERFGLTSEPYRAMHVLELIERVVAALDAREVGAGPRFALAAQEVVTAIEVAAAEGAEPYPGVPEFLARLCGAGFGVGIVTRNCRPAVERVVARWSLARDVLLTRDDVDRVKPDPEHLLAALEHLGAPPGNAVMCGDHPMDIVAGRRAGTGTVGILSDGLPADHFAAVEPDLVLPSVVGLERYLPRRRPS
jgi:phosphoglycolate phosphatase